MFALHTALVLHSAAGEGTCVYRETPLQYVEHKTNVASEPDQLQLYAAMLHTVQDVMSRLQVDSSR